MKKQLIGTLAVLLLASAAPQHSWAAVETWVGNTSANFNASNWTGTNNPPLTGDSWVFGAAGSSGTTLNNDLTTTSTNVAGITFNSGASTFTIAGNAFTLTGNILNSSTSLETINDAISMTATRTMTMTTGGGNITLGGDINGTGGGITLAGAGTLKLSGNNSFTGNVTSAASTTLIIGSNTALGGGTLTLSNNVSTVAGQFVIQGDGTPRTIANAININAVGLTSFGGSSALTFTGGLTNTTTGADRYLGPVRKERGFREVIRATPPDTTTYRQDSPAIFSEPAFFNDLHVIRPF